MAWEAGNTGPNRHVPQDGMGGDTFTGIYNRHVKTVYRLCYSFLGNAADAEDATQNVFMKLIREARRFNSPEHEKAWLIVCAQNHCRDVLRSSYRTQTALEGDQVFDNVEAPEQGQSDLLEAVLRLPDKYKTCMYLYYYEGYRSREIAEMIGIPDSTVRYYLGEARTLLKQELGGERGGGESIQ